MSNDAATAVGSQWLPSGNIEECLREFFRSPTDVKSGSGLYSCLYLLRRDAAQCFGFNPDSLQRCTSCFKPVLWPGVLAVFAGIDLLAKLHADDDDGPVGNRFEGYVGEHMRVPVGAQKHELWLLRNAMMHSFGLYAHDRGSCMAYRFLLTAGLPCLLEITGSSPTVVHVDVLRLWYAFEVSIPAFQGAVEADFARRPKLTALLEKYGFTTIGKVRDIANA